MFLQYLQLPFILYEVSALLLLCIQQEWKAYKCDSEPSPGKNPGQTLSDSVTFQLPLACSEFEVPMYLSSSFLFSQLSMAVLHFTNS